MAEPIPMRVHQHFKGETKKYTVLCVSTDVEPPHAERVGYIPLYGENAGIVLSRELAVWDAEVERDGYKGPRFWPLPAQKPTLS